MGDWMPWVLWGAGGLALYLLNRISDNTAAILRILAQRELKRRGDDLDRAAWDVPD